MQFSVQARVALNFVGGRGGYCCSARFWPADEAVVTDRVTEGMLADENLNIVPVEVVGDEAVVTDRVTKRAKAKAGADLVETPAGESPAD